MSSGRSSGCRLFFLLLLLANPQPNGNLSAYVDARPLPFLDQQKYVKVLSSLGMVCRCCDGAAGGECRSKWDATCTKLECRPWKLF